MIKNGRPYTSENQYNGGVDDSLITSRPKGEQETVFSWIRENLTPTKSTVYTGMSSYGLKHLLQHDTGVYLTNNEFKDAMLCCGYAPNDPDEANWYYKISRKSVALKN